MFPECELEIELKYRDCLKCKDRCALGKSTIDYWESYVVDKYHKQAEKNGLLNFGKTKKKGGE